MNPRLFFLGTLLSSTLPLFGEPGGHPPGPPSADERLEHLKRDLNLSPSQASKLRPVLLATEQKLKALHSEPSLSEEQRREKAQAIRRAGGEAIKAHLSPEQAAAFDAEVQRRHKEGPPGGGPGGKGKPEGNGPKSK
jgi:hypothetical protein